MYHLEYARIRVIFVSFLRPEAQVVNDRLNKTLHIAVTTPGELPEGSSLALYPLGQAKGGGTTMGHPKRKRQLEAIKAVERTLKEMDFAEYSATVVRRVSEKAALYDRIRAKSLARAGNYILR